MKIFETGYTNQRSTIVMRADFATGLIEHGDELVLDKSNFLPYRGETKFKCRLRVAAVSSIKDFAREKLAVLDAKFPNLEADHSNTRCDLSLANGIVEVLCPLSSQAFKPSTSTKTRNLVAYFCRSDFRFRRHSSDEIIQAVERKLFLPFNPTFLFQYWISIHGPASMFVKDQYEEFEKGVVSGGRPESDRRRF